DGRLVARTKRRSVGASLQNLDVVLCDERLDRGMIVIIAAIDVDEVFGEAPGMTVRCRRASCDPTLRNVWGMSRGPTTMAPAVAVTFCPPMVISNSPSRT